MPTTSNDYPSTSYLGVPDGYRINLGRSPGVQMAPQYRGDNLGGVIGTGRYPGQTVYAYPRYTEQDVNRVGNMPRGDMIDLQERLAYAGFITSVRKGDPNQTMAAYRNALGEANGYGADVDEYLKARIAARYGGDASPYGSGGSGGGGGGSSSSSTSISNSSMTTRSVNLTGRGTAEGILRNALTQELGREPTAREVQDFKRSLNVKERKNPTITKSTSSTTTTSSQSSKGNHVSSTSNTSGTSSSTTKQSDIDPSEEALDFAKSSKKLRQERRMYQNSQYLDVIEAMMGVQ